MPYKITINANSTVNELFHSGISPASIIPAEAVTITDAQGDMLRSCDCFGAYSYINGEVVLTPGP